jgi:CheY-like chemotaxis protein
VQPDRSASESPYAIGTPGRRKRSQNDKGRSRAPIRSASSTGRSTQDSDVIVIVDDDTDTREAIRTLLEDEGYRTAQAGDGQEALALVRHAEFKAALILMDLMMPRMDGLQLRARLRADPTLAAIPIVIMTAHGGMLRALEDSKPPTPVLRKPLDLDRLLEIVEIHCP